MILNKMIRRFAYYIAVQMASLVLILVDANGRSGLTDSLFIEVTPDTAAAREWQQDYSFAIAITDNQGRPRRVEVDVDDMLNDTILTLNTDSGGKAAYFATVPFGKPDGTYEITFRARKNLFESSEKLSVFVPVEHDYAKLNIKITPEAIFILDYGDIVNYSFSITDEYGNFIDSAGVYIDSGLLELPVTIFSDTSGSGEFTITIPENIQNGEYRVQFSAEKFGFTTSDSLFRIIRVEHLPSNIAFGHRTIEVRPYPNPANDFVNIILPEGFFNPEELINIDNLRIYDYSGKICRSGNSAEYIRDNTFRINLSRLDAGYYFIALAGSNGDFIFPVLIK